VTIFVNLQNPLNKKKKKFSEGTDHYRATLPNKRRTKLSKPSKRYKHTDIYDAHNYYEDNSNINSNTEPYYEKNNYSRGVRRLPNHNGPETHSTLQDIHYGSGEKGDYEAYSTKDILNYESINDSPAESYSKIHNDIYECPGNDEIYNTDNESDGEPNDTLEPFEGEANFKHLSQILNTHKPVKEAETPVVNSNNLYDLILYIFTGVFYLVLCDFIYKLGKKTY